MVEGIYRVDKKAGDDGVPESCLGLVAVVFVWSVDILEVAWAKRQSQCACS